MKQGTLVNTEDISPEIAIGEYRLWRKRTVKMFNFLRKRR